MKKNILSLICLLFLFCTGFTILEKDRIIYEVPAAVEDKIFAYMQSYIPPEKTRYFIQWKSTHDTISLLVSLDNYVPNEPFSELIEQSNRCVELSKHKLMIPMVFHSDIYESKNLMVEYQKGTPYYIKQREFPLLHGMVIKFIYDHKNYPEGKIVQ